MKDNKKDVIKPLTVMSLFDGIACGRVALERANIPVNKYYASEIDKYAIAITQKNYPDIIQLGDIEKIDFTQYRGKIDLLIGGSPCTNLSFCGNRKGLEGNESRLFWEYARAIKECKPKYFLLENVKMKKEWENIITNELGVCPIEINSSLLSAQNRKRLYWTNILNVTIPEDKHILLKDILCDDGINTFQYNRKNKLVKETEKSLALCSSDWRGLNRNQNQNAVFSLIKEYIVPIDKTLVVLEKEVQEGKLGYFRKDSQANRVYYPTQKGITLCGEAGGGCAKMGQYFFGEVIKDFKELDLSQYKYPCFILKTDKGNDVLLIGYIRMLTPVECERLQTLPDNYTCKGIINNEIVDISRTQRYKCLGNGWTVDVVAHILKGLKQEG